MAAASHPGPRKPSEAYRDRNGYKEDVDAASTATGQEAVSRRRLAEFVLEDLGEYLPSMAKMKEATAASPIDSLATQKDRLDERLEEERMRHLRDLKKLCADHANQHHWTALERYLSKNDDVKTPADIGSTLEFSNAFENLRYGYLQATLPLRKRRNELQTLAEAEERRLNAQFPQSIYDFRTMRSKEMQLRVARFLMAERPAKEKMLSELGWAWRQVTPLLQRMNEEDFKAEVQALAKELDSRDPRKRPRIASTSTS